MRKFGIILFLILSVLPIWNVYAQSSNVGFVSGDIWYSKDPLEEGDKVNIYTLLFNPDKRELSGTVIFFNKTVFLGKKDFIVPANGVKDIYINWTVTAGSHTIFGKIENAKFLVSKGIYEDVYLANNETEKSTETVNKKIIPDLKNLDENTKASDNSDNSSLGSIENIQNLIKENTPDFIAKPIILTANVVDGWREGLSIVSDKKKEAVKNEINILKSQEEINSETPSDSKNK